MDQTYVLALADAPAGTGSLVRETLTLANKGWQWFTSWITKPGNLAKLVKIAEDVLAKDREQAKKDLLALFTSSANGS